MKYLKKFNESLSDDESQIRELLNSGKRIEIISINNFENKGEITFELEAKGVWMKGEAKTQVRNILKTKYSEVKVVSDKNVLSISLSK